MKQYSHPNSNGWKFILEALTAPVAQKLGGIVLCHDGIAQQSILLKLTELTKLPCLVFSFN